MNQQFQCSGSARGLSDATSIELQQLDRFFAFSDSSARSPRDTLNLEPAFVAATRWTNQDRPRLNSPQHHHDFSPNGPHRGVPAAVALNMTRGDRQTSPSILERYAQTIPLSASCQSIQKRCLFPDCAKMAVSKGLCRGHGGGRRCHFAGGCTKSAQSRSVFCWAHGGGQRCDVETCMRSRKTKHFCVAHMHQEAEDSESLSSGKSPRVPRARRSRYVPVATRTHRQSSQRMLPSLGQALSAASLSLPSFPIFPRLRTRSLGE